MDATFLEIVNLEKRFGETQALCGVSLTLKKGNIIGLLGVNGAGKTTLSSIIATIRPPCAGDIFFNGESIYSNINLFRQQIGYCPQVSNIHAELTVKENLIADGRYFGMNTADSAARAKQLAHKLQFASYLDSYPVTLSGGYKQRVLIARALMHSSRLIILDEPTAGLDPQVRRELWALIKELRDEGITILITTSIIAYFA